MDKAAYVKAQPQTRSHACHWPGCPKQVPPAKWGCRPHWFALPLAKRQALWATYRPGQEIDGHPSKNYVRVAREVQEWIAAHELKNKAEDANDDLFADYPTLTPGRITYGTLRAIIDWRARHGIGDVSLATLEACREEGQGAARAGLELGLIDYGQATGWVD